MNVQALLEWQPDNFSEGHASNFLVQIFKKTKRWHLVYYNPPGGSWKLISLVKGDFEYMQVAPKRGVGRVKRPDIALQYLSNSEDFVRLFLLESKPDKNQWDANLPVLLKAYFEGDGGFKGIRKVPLWHKRKRDGGEWKELQKDDPERRWFEKCGGSYIFGFIYILRLINLKKDLSTEIAWMKRNIDAMHKPTPPVVMIAAGWRKNTFEPFVLAEYSETFPKNIRTDLESTFSNYLLDIRSEIPSLNKFI